MNIGWGARRPGADGGPVEPPAVADLESFGVGISLYLTIPMAERPDPEVPEGPVLVDATFTPRAHHLDRHGRLGTGVLATLIDSVGGMVSGLSVLPDWIVTTNLTLRRPVGSAVAVTEGQPVELRSRILRRGRTSAVCEVDVVDHLGTTVATAWMTSAVLTPEHGPPPIPRPLRPMPVPAIDDPLYRTDTDTFFSVQDGDRPGEVRIDAPTRLRNPWGIVHGGALAVAAETAARRAVAHPTGIDVDADDLVVTDLVLHYLSPVRVGPVVAAAEMVGSRGDDHLVRTTVRDHGADDRSCVLAVATVRPG